MQGVNIFVRQSFVGKCLSNETSKNFSQPFLTTIISKSSNHNFEVNHIVALDWLSIWAARAEPGLGSCSPYTQPIKCNYVVDFKIMVAWLWNYSCKERLREIFRSFVWQTLAHKRLSDKNVNALHLLRKNLPWTPQFDIGSMQGWSSVLWIHASCFIRATVKWETSWPQILSG